jgi:hypothetical protein
MTIALAGYAGDPVGVTLSDTDSPVIAFQGVGALPPLGNSGKKWQFKTKADGVQKVLLRTAPASQPGMFKLQVKTKHWFTAAAANQSAADTQLTVQIGDLCFEHAATKKKD